MTEKTILAMYEAMAVGASIQRLAEIASEGMGNPINVSSVALDVLGYATPCEVDDEYWNSHNSSDVRTHYELEQIALEVGILPTHEPQILDKEPMRHRIMSCGAMRRNRPLAYVLALEYTHPFTEDDYVLLKALARIVAFRLANQPMDECQPGDAADRMMRGLLEGKLIPQDIVEATRLVEPANSDFCIIVAEPVSGFRDTVVPEHFVRALSQELPRGRVIAFRGRVVVMLPVAKKEADPAELCNRLGRIMKKRGMRCGISNVAGIRPGSVRRAYEQGLEVLQLGIDLFNDERIRCYHHQTLVPFRLFEAASQYDLWSLCDPAVEKLMEYDREYGTEWFVTAATFAFCNANTVQTAEKLNIHKSTMQYRLKKIGQILGLEWHDYCMLDSIKRTLYLWYYLERDKMLVEWGIDKDLLLSSIGIQLSS